MSPEREIEEVLARYVRAADHRDPTAMSKLFTDDAVVEIYYTGGGAAEPLGELHGAETIGQAVAGQMAAHPPLGWSHHTTLNPIVRVDGNTGTFDAQFVVYDVRGRERPATGWPAGSLGAQGSIVPIESGYLLATLLRTEGGWKLTRHIIRHDLPYAFPS
ncbi:nuclear transport factor 2 family protein [Frankia sp. AgB1.9]|uniref:nuclear transport factor 2 family protein n=1 Tax=unclassified Frankia TaxID=2632575 RepID=UPI0019347C25|nr:MULTISPECIES: nuclear transport factor 2 family protein [unclassified Frankia]MBL7488877.1 nuclear transport factor 2 family protein [Frankia sp. AgW1.1]MBL7547613.1 nuclear transport factor 2 family protein [Frankia sp. AgB1.9]MBL7621492.1 nuclear transport factor 2 family protein [Frankia sp. AgB1.8]